MENYDVVVVGAGNAALCAAIAAKEKGAQVLVLERGPVEKRGGNSFFTDGAIRVAYNDLDSIRKLIPEITDEEAEKIVMPEYNYSDFYDDLMRVTEGKSDPILANQLISKSYETISWMADLGIRFELNENQSFEQDGKLHFWGGLPIKTQNKGVGLIQMLLERAEKIGIDIWYDSRAIELIVDNDQITGIIIDQKEKVITVNTSSVILACGSFEANKKMRSEHLGEEWKKQL